MAKIRDLFGKALTMATAKQLLQYLTNRGTEAQCGRVLAAAGVKFKDSSNDYLVDCDGHLINSEGQVVNFSMGNVTGFTVPDKDGPIEPGTAIDGPMLSESVTEAQIGSDETLAKTPVSEQPGVSQTVPNAEAAGSSLANIPAPKAEAAGTPGGPPVK